MTDSQKIKQLEILLELIEADCVHYQERRDNAFDQKIKEYYEKKIWRARLDFERITRRVNSLKSILKKQPK
ncbi:MAG: hypothetical protein IKP64_02415 [Selenomonadaceae bacterium]|nr:hypothetical protein [Selenomonadaceae bacterium]